jgi:multidrug efflux pump subunit AcrB
MSDESLGFSARVASLFIRSKLTPLIILVSLALGTLAIYTTAREEDPSVTITVADVFVAFPGRGTTDVDERIARPVAAWILEIPSVEHVISSAADDGAMFVVQFREGVERDQALSQLYERLNANRDSLPARVPAPLVVPRGIEDVPVLAVTLWHETDDAVLVRRLAAEFATELEALPGVSRVQLTGGSRREIVVELDANRLAERGLGADRIVQAVQAANVRLPAGELAGPGGSFRVETGALLSSAQDVEALVVGATPAGPVYLRDIATVRDGVAEPRSYVAHLQRGDGWSSHAAVTLAIHKIRGVDAAGLTDRARGLLDRLAPELLPRDVHLSITRDAGRTATHRVVTLIEHMAIATLVVVLLIALALGRREAVIVAIVIPITLAIVPFVYKMTGFTLNRMTLSAMIFAIGILVDDAIVVIENIHRHYQERSAEKDLVRVTLEAVGEVGNPTILATFTVIAALMPTAFVSGMMGQFLRALPIGASVAMVYSLFIALAVTPYLAYRLLRHPSRENGSQDGSELAVIPATSSVSSQPRVGNGASLASDQRLGRSHPHAPRISGARCRPRCRRQDAPACRCGRNVSDDRPAAQLNARGYLRARHRRRAGARGNPGDRHVSGLRGNCGSHHVPGRGSPLHAEAASLPGRTTDRVSAERRTPADQSSACRRSTPGGD